MGVDIGQIKLYPFEQTVNMIKGIRALTKKSPAPCKRPLYSRFLTKKRLKPLQTTA